MKYITEENVLGIHKRVVDKTGGSHGVRDVELLRSAVERPKSTFDGKDLYPTVFKKAACYMESFVKHHVFVDGNKRTSITASARFLHLNGYKLKATNREVVDFVLSVIEKDKSVDQIAKWLESNCKKTGQ